MRLLVFGLFVIANCAQADEKPLVAVPAFSTAQDVNHPFPLEQSFSWLQRTVDIPVNANWGATELAAAGSLEAINAALSLGATAINLQCRSARNASVIFPDLTIELQRDGIGVLHQTYFEELQLYSTRNGPDVHVPAQSEWRETIKYLHTLDPTESSWTLSESALVPHDFTDVTLPEKLPPAPPKGFVVSDPRAILTILKQPPKAVPPLDATPKRLEPAGDLAAFEQIVFDSSHGEPRTDRPEVKKAKIARGQELPVTPRLALVRLTIYAPSRVIALAPQLSGSKDASTRRNLAWCLGMIAKHRRELVTTEIEGVLNRFLYDPDPTVRAEAAEACGRARLVTAAPVIAEEIQKQVPLTGQEESQLESLQQAIENRAKLAQALGFLGVKSPEVIDALKDLVRQPTEHPDPNWSRLDGGLAAWALGTLQAKEGAGVLTDALLTARSVRPTLDGNVNKPDAITRGLPIDRVHWFAAFALAEIGTEEALIGLETAMNSPPDPKLPENDRLGGLAARALARFRAESRAPILAKLLVHENSLVRRAGVLGCLQETDPACRTLLELGASWAVPWWDVQHAKP